MAISIDDPRLVESFRAGENEAFEALMRAHRPALYRHAMRRLSDHASAEDAVQETFTRAYRSRARVGDDWRLSAWLHQILANVCIDEANRRRREHDKSSRWAVTDMPSRGVLPDLDLQLGLDVDHTNVTEALQQLPESYQEALSLRYVAEMEYDEIAEVLDVSEENARARVSRASKAMRLLLRPVAAFIAFFSAVFFRRGDKAAKAMSLADSATASQSVATNASLYSTFVETAQAVAVQAPHAMPLISKAAIGIGAALVATAPVTAPAVIDQFRDETVAVEAPTLVDDSDTTDSTLPGSTDDATDGDGTDGDAPLLQPVDGVVDTPLVTIAPGQAEYGTESAIQNGVAPTDDDTTDGATAVPAPVLPTATSGESGVVSGSVSLVPSGPRLDLSGSASLVVGDRTLSGALSGRVNIAVDVDSSNRHRLDGTLRLTTSDGVIEVRLVGYAVDQGDGTYTVSGAFRAIVGSSNLGDTGSFAGSLAPDFSLSLSV